VADLIGPTIPIAGIIGLEDRPPTEAISGIASVRDYCASKGIPFTPVESYSFSSPRDRDRVLALSISTLLVLGWQRLVPPWLIDHCRGNVIGSHGSWAGITAGRGRSPQNWSLMFGKNRFE
jgi:methionyl-tRNA formyltransferase